MNEGETYYDKSDSPNNNNEKSTYYNKLLNKSKTYLIKTFSFPNNIQIHELFTLFDKLAKREGVPKSQLFLKALIEYVNRHCVPNPQMTLDRTLELGLPAKAHDVCCVPGCKRKAKFRKQLRSYDGKTEIFQVCEFHKRWRHKDFPFLISFKKLE